MQVFLRGLALGLQKSLQFLLTRDLKIWPGDLRENADRKADHNRKRVIFSLLEIIRGASNRF